LVATPPKRSKPVECECWKVSVHSWIGVDVEGVRVGKGHHRQGGFDPVAGDHDRGLAEVELGFAWRLAERDEDLTRVQPPLGHCRSDLGLRAVVAVLVAEALEDPLGRVALLGRRVTVVDQDLVDDTDELAELRLGPRGALAVAGGLRVGQDLLEGL
jgi:hypothetical protein